MKKFYKKYKMMQDYSQIFHQEVVDTKDLKVKIVNHKVFNKV
jgi:hypothetical protein